MTQRYSAQLREAREREWTREGAQARLGFDEARSWVQIVKDRVRSSRAAEAEVMRAAYVARAPAPIDDPDFALGSAPIAGVNPALSISGPIAAPQFFGSLRYLGQLDLTYLVCEADGELVLIDQHVAHERVELARLKAGGDREIATQQMLFPTTIEVGPALVELAAEMAAVLAQAGYETEAFGKSTLAVKAVPGGIRHGDPTQLLRTLLADWANDGAPTEAERLEGVLAEIACHSVVRAGDRLSPSEAEALLRSMDGADFSMHGPHGRPVLLRLPLAEIARRFGR
jgi:DNA mismatch repair protein MutL